MFDFPVGILHASTKSMKMHSTNFQSIIFFQTVPLEEKYNAYPHPNVMLA